MKRFKHQEEEEVATQIYELVQEHEPGISRIVPLREFACEELERGYPREALLDDFERVREVLEAEDRNDEEDDIVTVMDALVGWRSPGARL